MLAALTGMGLSAAAGLNAYIPFLVVALVARFTDYITLPVGYEWIESNWAIGIGAALLLAEVILDKIPAVDTINDTIQTFIRPSMGGLIFAATDGRGPELDNSTWMEENAWVSVVLGRARSPGWCTPARWRPDPVINVGTVGTGAPVVSTVEDVASLGLSLIALIAPGARHRRPGAARLAAHLDVAAACAGGGAPDATPPTPATADARRRVSPRRPGPTAARVKVVGAAPVGEDEVGRLALRADGPQQGARCRRRPPTGVPRPPRPSR